MQVALLDALYGLNAETIIAMARVHAAGGS
jgi:hypothetical protein